MKAIIALSLVYLSLLSMNALAQDCGCDHVLALDGPGVVDVLKAEDFDYEPGDVFCIQTGNHVSIRFNDFVGSPTEPLVIKNCGGPVNISGDIYAGLAFNNSQYVIVDGSGHSGTEYGIRINKSGGMTGLTVGSLSSDFEIHHLEISNTGFAGIMAKTDPSCDNPAGWRENFTMKNLNFHHNYIHDTHGEGFYIGYSGGWVTTNRSCDGEDIFGHFLENVEVHHNILERTGWDGIQVSLAHKNASIHDNVIKTFGVEMEKFQNFGLSIGSGSQIKIYNNIISNVAPYNRTDGNFGMQLISPLTGTYIYNNVVSNVGDHGVFLHVRAATQHLESPTQKGYYFLNNTFVNTGLSGLVDATLGGSGIFSNFNPTDGSTRPAPLINVYRNNIIVNPFHNYDNSGFWKKHDEAFFDFNTPAERDEAVKINNRMVRDLAAENFVNVAAENFSLTILSPAVNAGDDLSSFGFSTDTLNTARPTGAWDQGAYEFVPSNRPKPPTGVAVELIGE